MGSVRKVLRKCWEQTRKLRGKILEKYCESNGKVPGQYKKSYEKVLESTDKISRKL